MAAEAAAKAKAEQERQAAEAAAKAKAEQERQAAIAAAEKAEKERLAAEAAAKAEQERLAAAAAEEARLNNLIKSKTEGAWIRPMGAAQGLKCTSQVKLLPSGDVMDAVVVGSSGDPIFDRSAENAVRKASPLPVPQDKILFNQKYRVFNLSFKPE